MLRIESQRGVVRRVAFGRSPKKTALDLSPGFPVPQLQILLTIGPLVSFLN